MLHFESSLIVEEPTQKVPADAETGAASDRVLPMRMCCCQLASGEKAPQQRDCEQLSGIQYMKRPMNACSTASHEACKLYVGIHCTLLALCRHALGPGWLIIMSGSDASTGNACRTSRRWQRCHRVFSELKRKNHATIQTKAKRYSATSS
jgi:hypothetical protein